MNIYIRDFQTKLLTLSLFVILSIFYQNAISDPFSWDGEDLTVQTGSLGNLKDANNIKYRLGYRNGGFGHLQIALELSWCDVAGKNQKQMLFQKMVDWRPRDIKSNYEKSLVIIEFEQPCGPDEEDILQKPLFYKYNSENRQFRLMNSS